MCIRSLQLVRTPQVTSRSETAALQRPLLVHCQIQEAEPDPPSLMIPTDTMQNISLKHSTTVTATQIVAQRGSAASGSRQEAKKGDHEILLIFPYRKVGCRSMCSLIRNFRMGRSMARGMRMVILSASLHQNNTNMHGCCSIKVVGIFIY